MVQSTYTTVVNRAESVPSATYMYNVQKYENERYVHVDALVVAIISLLAVQHGPVMMDYRYM